DSLRALGFTFHSLRQMERPFHSGRIYATGGSGGGNVTLMANKLAPRTFACVIDLCGMARLNDDIAYNLPGGSRLDARWSRDPQSPNYLSPDAQEIRFIGHPQHLTIMRELGSSSHVIVVHGVDDDVCPLSDKQEMAAHMQQAGLSVEPYWISRDDVDGTAVTNSGHSLGDRTEIVHRFAVRFLSPTSDQALIRKGPSDFELADERVRYPTSHGAFVISYAGGYPNGRFEPHAESTAPEAKPKTAP
ncbi:MAG: DUF2920 family protein, partial [Planctomycetaceae bacterium]|nr:DUF2920 family protein [Planctomycetaceae bacterium]